MVNINPIRSIVVLGLIAATHVACLPPAAARLNQASELYRAGRFEESIAEYQEVIKMQPAWPAPYLGLGNALMSIGQLAPAIEEYRMAVKLGPDWAEAHVLLGEALVQSRSWALAVPVLQKAAALNDRDPVSRSLLGLSLAELGREREALEAFESVSGLCETCLDKRASLVFAQLKSRLRQ